MLSGEVPFAAESEEELLAKQSENPPVPLSAFRNDIPDGLEPVILRAISSNPDMRYQKASAFSEDLAHFLSSSDETELISAAKTPIAPEDNNNMWKTAFVVLAGISLLAVGMIYATYTKQTDPGTQLQADINGQPVQPLNPATGITEQNLAYTNDGTMPEIVGNSQFPTADGLPGGDGLNVWNKYGGAPPPGAPTYPSGGQVITIPGDGSGSQFMPGLDASGGIILIPVQVTPTPTPKAGNTPQPANTQETPAVKETPAGTNPVPKTSPEAAKPEKTPAAKPKETKPATPPDKKLQSGKEQDSN